jgi:hypothetical protein
MPNACLIPITHEIRAIKYQIAPKQFKKKKGMEVLIQ